jgi:deoxyguanosine kinase
MNFRYLVVEGPIGVGKTDLARQLAEAFQGRSLLDQPLESPFLSRFYEGQPGAAFMSQLLFLARRATLLKDLTRSFPTHTCVVSDFLLEKDKLFACLNLNDEELHVYNQLFDAMADYLIQPDLVIYLKADVPTLSERIRRRDFTAEHRLTVTYLQNLIEAYEHFFFQYQQRTRAPLLVLESGQIDFGVGGPRVDELVNYLRFKNVVGLQYYTPAGRG